MRNGVHMIHLEHGQHTGSACGLVVAGGICGGWWQQGGTLNRRDGRLDGWTRRPVGRRGRVHRGCRAQGGRAGTWAEYRRRQADENLGLPATRSRS